MSREHLLHPLASRNLAQDSPLKLSVLIPTYQRASKLRLCLECLAEQDVDADFEVIVGVDGGAEHGGATLEIPERLADKMRVELFPKIGLIAIRQRMLDAARGAIFLSLNDDAYAQPGLLRTHLNLHAGAEPVVATGPAEWLSIAEPNLFDVMIQRTAILFFPPPKPHASSPYAVDYRNCFGLNMSASTDLTRRLGGFPDFANAYGYDDTELAHRLQHQGGAAIIHAPDAQVVHDHRMTPTDLHRREYLLGRSAWSFADYNPAFAQDIFRRDIRTADELDYIDRALARERLDAERIERSFLSLSEKPAGMADDDLLSVLAEQWTPLKRYLWRWGLYDAAHEEPMRWSLLRDASALP